LKIYVRMLINLVLYVGTTLLVFEGVGRASSANETLQKLLDANPPVLLILVACIVYLLLALAFRVRGRLSKSEPPRLLDAVRFRRLQGASFAASLAVGAGCALFYFGLMKLPFLPDRVHFELNNYVDVFSKSDAWVFAILGVGIVGVLFEEIYFRGLIFGELRKSLPLPVAFAGHALIYAYFQPNLSVSFTAFFLALFYSYMYGKTQSIWSTVTAAATLNILIVASKELGLLDLMGDANAAASIALLLAGAVGVVLGLYAIRRTAAPGLDEQPEGKASRLVRAFAWVGLYIAVYYAVLSTVNYVWTKVLIRYEPIQPWLSDSANNLWALVLNDLIAVPIYMFLLRRYQATSLIRHCGFRRIDGRTAARIAALSVSMGLWVISVAKIPFVEDRFPQFDALFESLVGGPLLTFAVFLIIHSVYKEILFRGLVFGAFRTAMPLAAALALNALVYGQLFFRLDPALTVYGGLGTVIFGLLYVWHRSLWAPIVAQLGLFATYYAAWQGMAAFDIAFGGAFYAVMAVSSASVLYFMFRLWSTRTAAGKRERPAPVTMEGAEHAGI